MRNAVFIVAILFLACGRPMEPEPAEAQDSSLTALPAADSTALLITCEGVGKIKLADDLQLISKKAGAANVSSDSLFVEGLFEGMVTKVWKGTPREVTIHWVEKEEPYRTIKMLEVSHRESVYHFSNGVGIGTSLKRLVELNGGRPVSLYGFGWDYGGTFISFRNGKLAREIPCFGGVFQLLSADIVTPELKKIMGDREILSDAEALKQYPAALVKIRVKRQEVSLNEVAAK